MISSLITAVILLLNVHHIGDFCTQGTRISIDSIPSIKILTNQTDSYDLRFIECLKTMPCNQIILDDSLMTVDNSKSILPVFLPLMKTITYACTTKNVNWVLKVKRINYTNLLFNFTKVSSSHDSIFHSGNVFLPCAFYWEGETNSDEQGNVYQVDQYLFDEKDISIGIRINADKATFYYLNKDNRLNIEKSPTLLRK